MSSKPVDPVEEGDDLATDLDIMLETLGMFGVEFTLIRDEAGSTIEVTGGSRGTHGFSGIAVTYNFAPPDVNPDRSERFLFMGLVKS